MSNQEFSKEELEQAEKLKRKTPGAANLKTEDVAKILREAKKITAEGMQPKVSLPKKNI